MTRGTTGNIRNAPGGGAFLVFPAKEAVRKLIDAPKDELQRGRACFETRPLGAPQHEVIL
jgi:hypothetical protein